jgi:exonuclease SbcC
VRPVSLRLQAFGSYAGELHLDFARLSRHGIFAISGPTGAGKSTIFDALVYALYDDLPGFRINGNVRSQFADPSTLTYVTLEFVVHGERWRVERRPTQLVSRQRGHGSPIERKSAVSLGRVGEDGDLLAGTATTKKDEAKRRIDMLVGLTKEQFEQVVLIPQGRFEEVLKADTSKRAPLLRRLFPVEVFTRVAESLKSMALHRQGEFDAATRAVDAVAGRLGEAYDAAVAQLPADVRDALFGSDELPRFDVGRLASHVGELEEALRLVDASVAALRSAAETARAQLVDARRMADEWDRWRADLAAAESFAEEERRDLEERALLERARRLTHLGGVLAELEEARRRLAVLEPETSGLVDAIDAAWPGELGGRARTDARDAWKLAERLTSDARHLRAEAGRFERLAESRRSLAARGSALGERRVELTERALKLEVEEQSVGFVADEVRRLRTEASLLDPLCQAVDALEREHQVAARRAAAAAELEQVEAELAEATVAATLAAGRADDVRTSWRDGLAGRLARLLEDGAPCPTCGALEHPAPAGWRQEGADDDALAEAEAARDGALRVRSVAEQRVAAARGVIHALAETRPLDAVEADLAARRQALVAVLDAAERLTGMAAEEERRRTALIADRELLGSDQRVLDADVARMEADEAAHAREVEEYVQAHGWFESPAARAAARAAMAGEVGRLAAMLEELGIAHETARRCAALVDPVARELEVADPGELRSFVLESGEIEARSESLDGRRSCRQEIRRRIADFPADAARSGRPDVEAFEAAAERSAEAHDSLLGRRAVLADRAAAIASGPSELASAARAVDAARTAFEQAKTVADRCAGAGGGSASARLSLENWVLADYLRQVLVQANHRLDAMTDGRFALELNDGVTDGRKPWGLDLAVFDANTGQVRPATTLSGGETFMAALALALGLADVVSGGSNREVGALFVDEGFGSLDPQSLDSVIDVLRSLEDGGRIVGIVSHVRELQLALPSGITVEPSALGSRAVLHYPPD